MNNVMCLAGKWRFCLDRQNVGEADKWYNTILKDEINLPGTTGENCYGDLVEKFETDRLSQVYKYVGNAWYQRDIIIPEHWCEKHIVLYLERCHWFTKVWFDDVDLGENDSLSTGNYYDIPPNIIPGKHTITICTDNSVRYALSNHHFSNDTQTNWNGIVGDISLTAYDKIYIDRVTVDTDIYKKLVYCKLHIRNLTGERIASCISVSINEKNRISINSDITEQPYQDISFEIEMGEDMILWDEFDPVMHELKVELEAGKYISNYNESFGCREFKREGKKLLMNGNAVFMRGTHDACVFPITGYPPMDVEEWVRVFEICKDYGLNHYRFHSWCPPKAAFIAADKVGMYMQIEAPASGTIGAGQTEKAIDGLTGQQRVQNFIIDETLKILKEYGNHPSFMMFSVGNELHNNDEFGGRVVKMAKDYDKRHLYASGSNNNWEDPKVKPNDDYFVAFQTGKWDGLLRGSYHLSQLGHINNQLPSTDVDYSDAIKELDIPVISHEVGQYLAYPDYSEIEKYTGVLKPKNLEYFKESLHKKGMEHYASDFAKASGALQVELYKEEIEAALRTRELGGFQLLDIKDYPGQGTALCGILDSFMGSKGFIEPEQWRHFCCETVPLLRMKKRVWETNESFKAILEVANYDKKTIYGAKPVWWISDENGYKLFEGKGDIADIANGCVTTVGNIEVPLCQIKQTGKYTVHFALYGTKYINSWNIWVYCAEIVMPETNNIYIAKIWNSKTQAALERGENVLFLGNADNLLNTIEGAFQSNFWCYNMFKCFNPPGTLGILCDKQSKVFENFPTDSHSDWQWWEIVKKARPIVLDYVDSNLNPLVRVIDTYDRNLRLGILLEIKAGNGKILISSLELDKYIEHSPVIRQYYYSILKYMNSAEFEPKVCMAIRTLDSILKFTE